MERIDAIEKLLKKNKVDCLVSSERSYAVGRSALCRIANYPTLSSLNLEDLIKLLCDDYDDSCEAICEDLYLFIQGCQAAHLTSEFDILRGLAEILLNLIW